MGYVISNPTKNSKKKKKTVKVITTEMIVTVVCSKLAVGMEHTTAFSGLVACFVENLISSLVSRKVFQLFQLDFEYSRFRKQSPNSLFLLLLLF